MNRKTRKYRLKKLAEFLYKLDPKLLDLEDWKKETDCGAVCCAVGWIPEALPRSGLTMESSSTYTETIHYPLFRGETHWRAVRMFFGLEGCNDIEDYMFAERYYNSNNEQPTPSEIADRLLEVAEMTDEELRRDFYELLHY